MRKIKLAFLSKVDLSPHPHLLVTREKDEMVDASGRNELLPKGGGPTLRDRVKILINREGLRVKPLLLHIEKCQLR